MGVYIINGRATRNKLDDRLHQGYFMVYADTKGVILYWKPDQPFIIHRTHHVWFDGFNSRLSIEYNHTPGSLLLWQYLKGRIYDLDLLNLILCGLDITFTPFSDETIIAYKIELTPYGKKIGFNLLDYAYFKIHYITDTIHKFLLACDGS